MNGNNGGNQKKYLEFSKKMAMLRKLDRLELISKEEYILAKNRILDFYHINEANYFQSGMLKPVG